MMFAADPPEVNYLGRIVNVHFFIVANRSSRIVVTLKLHFVTLAR
jgi:hypothetical protein